MEEEKTGEYVRIVSGKYKDCIGKIVYEYQHFKGFYLVKIMRAPKKTIYDWSPSQEIVVTKNNLRRLSPEELVFIEENKN
ncbi:MAG: hypothetical protein DRN29_06580 [Thermoplasmata archaeon]|nr:MAG: hypothetical protein DRN29_06580 [Thermoplasmata archaeon]